MIQDTTPAPAQMSSPGGMPPAGSLPGGPGGEDPAHSGPKGARRHRLGGDQRHCDQRLPRIPEGGRADLLALLNAPQEAG